MNEAPKNVEVSLSGGRLSGLITVAPRDPGGRIYTDLWVAVTPDRKVVVVPDAAPAELPAHRYRFTSWMGDNPVYQAVA